MRAQFISDNLAAASKPVRIFRDMIGSQDIDIAAELREGRIRDLFPAAFAFYDNIYHTYDINELLFITKRAYSLAGVKNAMILLGRYFGIEFTFMAPKDGDPTDMTDPDSFGKTYWKVYLIVNTPDGMVFKSVKVAISTINALIEELVFHAGDAANPDNNIKFEVIVQEDDLKNTDRDLLNITQTALVDKYFDEKNTFTHSLDIDSWYAIDFSDEKIEVTAIDRNYPFQVKYNYQFLMVKDSGISVSGIASGTGYTPAKLDYPRIRSGVLYQFWVREFKKSGDSWVAGDWVPIGNNIPGFTEETGVWILKDDIEVLKGVTLNNGVKGYTLKFTDKSVPGTYAIYFKISGASTWAGTLSSSITATGAEIEVPYSDVGISPSEASRYDAMFAFVRFINNDTQPPQDVDPDTDNIYYLAAPPYIKS